MIKNISPIYSWFVIPNIRPHRHLLLSALEDPIDIASCQRKYYRPLSQFNQFLCSFNLFCLLKKTNFYVHFRASPLMVGDNHRMPPVELDLLPSTLAKAPAGVRCGDSGMIEMPGDGQVCALEAEVQDEVEPPPRRGQG
jgi:hypothetical protein